MKLEKENYILMAIFLLALIARLVFALQSNNIPSSDAYVYDTLGVSLAEGRGYIDNNGSAHSFYPPAYPVFLSLIYKIFGHSYIYVRIIQSMLGAFSCVLIYLIGKRIYSAFSGVLAGFISAMYLPFIKSAGLLLTESVFTFILLAATFYLVKIQREKDRFRSYAVCGLLLGISALTKTMMLFFPLFIVPVFFKKDGYLPVFKKHFLILLFFGFSLLPWVIRNYHIYHKVMPTTTAAGLGLYSSYRPANGVFGTLASPDDPVMIEAAQFSSPVLRSDFLIKKTKDFIIANPGKVFMLEFKKILYLWLPFDWEIVGGRWFNLIYAVMLPFFALGLFFSLKKFMDFYPILLPIIYFQIMTLIFYGSPRFRLPIEPYIFILAIIGIIEFRKSIWRI